MNALQSALPFRLDGEVALVTGGGTGLGLGIARCMVAAGAQVVITGRRREPLDDALAELGSPATAVPCDVRDPGAASRLVQEVESQVGPLSILVNNAGLHLKKSALETSDEEFEAISDVHLVAAFRLARLAAQVMAPRRRGSLLFIGSMAGLFGIPLVAAYSSAKAAVVGLTRALAVEWAEHGLRVNAIAPGWIETAMSRGALDHDPERKGRILARTPMRRFGSPEDIGWAAVYLCSPAAGFVTGATLTVDGGASVGF